MGQLTSVTLLLFSEMKEKVIEKSPNAILRYTDRILFWGDEAEVLKVLTDKKIKSLQPFEFSNEMEEESCLFLNS